MVGKEGNQPKELQPHEIFGEIKISLQRLLVDPNSSIGQILDGQRNLTAHGFMNDTLKVLGENNVLQDVISVTESCALYADVRGNGKEAADLLQLKSGYELLQSFITGNKKQQGEIFQAKPEHTSKDSKKSMQQKKDKSPHDSQ